MLAVRHHCHRQADLALVQEGPGVEDPVLQEGDVADELIWISLKCHQTYFSNLTSVICGVNVLKTVIQHSSM